MSKKFRNKRDNGEGSIRQRENGRWEAALMDGYRPDGRPQMKYFSGKTKKEVLDKVNKWKVEKAMGLDISVHHPFNEWADFWFESHRENITATTQENYKYTLRILKDYFGTRRIDDIKPVDIEVFLKKLRADGRSDSYLSACRGMLYQIFQKAAGNDLVRKNPVAYAEKKRSQSPKKSKDAYTREELIALVRYLPEDKIGCAIRLLLCTGMRAQELLALEPRHIVEDGTFIRIEQAVSMVKGRVIVGQPKSRDSYRSVDIPPGFEKYAIALRETDDTYILQSPKGVQPCNPSYFRDKFKEAVEKIEGVRVLTPHCCRHTYVSTMQDIGVDVSTIQSFVGHADVDMTKHYLHVQKSIRERAVEKFSEVFLDFDIE